MLRIYIPVSSIYISTLGTGSANFRSWRKIFSNKIKSISYALIRKRKMFPLFVLVARFFIFSFLFARLQVLAYIFFLFNNFLLKFIVAVFFEISPRIRLDGASQSCRNLGQNRLRQGPADKSRRCTDSVPDCSDWAEIMAPHCCVNQI